MLSPDERRLVTGILALLLLGTVVRTCRHRAVEEQVPPAQLPRVEETESAETAPD